MRLLMATLWRDGSAWALFSEGGKELGFDVTEIPLDEERVIANLEVNNPIVAVMGPGDFTTTGHFIVLTGYENGKIKVNDPNNRENSEKLWEFDRIQSQIGICGYFRNLSRKNVPPVAAQWKKEPRDLFKKQPRGSFL